MSVWFSSKLKTRMAFNSINCKEFMSPISIIFSKKFTENDLRDRYQTYISLTGKLNVSNEFLPGLKIENPRRNLGRLKYPTWKCYEKLDVTQF